MKGLRFLSLFVLAVGVHFALAGNTSSGCEPQEGGCLSDADCQEGEFCDSNSGQCISFFDCTADSDCVKVQAGCCPCNEGGSSTAINRNYTSQWKAHLECEGDEYCLQVYRCMPLELPACVDGMCKLINLPDKRYCEEDSDCVCGGFDVDGTCFLGNRLYYEAYVDKSGVCPDFCGGFRGNLQIKCVDNRCTQVAVSNTP